MRRVAFIAALAAFAIGCKPESEDNAPAPEATNAGGGATAVDAPKADEAATAVTYAQVAPIFEKSCINCHGVKATKGDVNLTSYAAAMKGGEHGPIIVAGKPEESSIVSFIRGKVKPRMPMGGAPLPEDQIKLIEDWIRAGAKA
jgi:mono/diheme cytochrome c family protein